MKRFILSFLFLMTTFVFAQEERTEEGYRIIHIQKEQTKAYKDSVSKVDELKKPPVNFRRSFGLMLSVGYKNIFGSMDLYYYPSYDKEKESSELFSGASVQLGLSALFPLTQYNFAIRTGILFESTYLFCKKDLFFENQERPEEIRIERGRVVQGRIVFPLVFAMKTRTSPLMFEIGTQVSIPVVDKYKSEDLIEKDLRSPVDVAILFGGNVILNRYISLDLLWEIQVHKAYEDKFLVGVSSLLAGGIKLGVIFTPF